MIAEIAARFDATLGRFGVKSGAARAKAFADALHASNVRSPADLYWTARISMLPSIEDLARFDEAFLAMFLPPPPLDDLEAIVAFESKGAPPLPQRVAAAPSAPSVRGEATTEATLLAMASPEERLYERDFASMSDEELRALVELVARLRVPVQWRESRRRRRAARGDRLDVRATLRRALRSYGEPVQRMFTRPRERERPLIFLCDVSGSMAPYGRATLLYAQAVLLARRRVRAFAFATQLRELTQPMRELPAAAFVKQLPYLASGYGGGTRIASAIEHFVAGYAARSATRGGTVVILSDGWERESPERLGAAMKRLRLLTRRIVWINPNKKHPAFEPLARGMAAALPYVDALVEGHNLRTLAAVERALEESA